MTDLHILLAAQAASFENGSLGATLQRIGRQPGFRGAYRQSHDLFQKARQLGYQKEMPKLYYLRKNSHGERFQLEQ